MHRGFTYRLAPTPAQAATLDQWFGAARFVFNIGLEQRRDFWRQYRANTGKNINFPSQSRELTAAIATADWLREPPRVCLEQALRDLDGAFAKFFKGAGYPRFRRKGESDTLRVVGPGVSFRRLNAKWSAVKFPKLGWLKFRDTRPIGGEFGNVTVSRRGDVWSLSVCANIGEAPASVTGLAVGIDRGVANTLSLSTGELLSLPDMGGLDRRTRRAQRVLARRKRGSRRYAKQRARVALMKAKAGRIRRDWLHRASTDISRRFAMVAIEDLKVKNMTASAAGTVEKPGRMVRQKAGLNRSILAQGWTLFAGMLEYKLEARGGTLISVPAAYTSQTCQDCGVVDARSRKSQAVFECVACGHRAHADTNAALEILRRSTPGLLVEAPALGAVETRTCGLAA